MPTEPTSHPARSRLGAAIQRNRSAVLGRLMDLEWAADPRSPRVLVRGRDEVRPRAELFLESLLAGLLEDDWSAFDGVIASRTADLLRAGVVTADDLNRRAQVLATFLIPFALQEPEPAPVLAALFSTMQALSVRILGDYNDSLVEESRRLDDLKTMFLRLTGHELRAPLGTIRGYVSMLADGDLGRLEPPALKALGEIEAAAGSGLAMLERLGEVARLESGKEAVHRERHPLEEVAMAAVGPLDEAARGSGVRIEVEAEGEARMDAEEIVIALRNLVGNAVKYAASGGLIEVRGRREGGFTTFAVSDRGPGIAADELPHLFERYYRSRRSRESRTAGSGLGLYIVRRIAELHGGEASVESSPGQGATFWLRLPAE